MHVPSRLILPTPFKDLEEQFLIEEGEIAKEKCYLIRPKHPFDTKWTPETLIYRSSIWNEKKELISASFPKFFNWHEPFCQQQNYTEDILDLTFVEKIDGSALIASFYNGKWIFRARNTFSFEVMGPKTWDPLQSLVKKYNKFFESTVALSGAYSFIFEFLDLDNKIIIQPEEDDLILIGAISHSNYELQTQENLDELALAYSLKRPRTFHFSSLDAARKFIWEAEEMEGCCVYSPGKVLLKEGPQQVIRKLKSEDYLLKHKLKYGAKTGEKTLMQLYFNLGRPNTRNFYKALQNKFDYEILASIQEAVNEFTLAIEVTNEFLTYCHEELTKLKEENPDITSREIIELNDYNSYVKSFMIKLLPNKDIRDIDERSYKRLFKEISNNELPNWKPLPF